jgi:hypothetical protein
MIFSLYSGAIEKIIKELHFIESYIQPFVYCFNIFVYNSLDTISIEAKKEDDAWAKGS